MATVIPVEIGQVYVEREGKIGYWLVLSRHSDNDYAKWKVLVFYPVPSRRLPSVTNWSGEVRTDGSVRLLRPGESIPLPDGWL